MAKLNEELMRSVRESEEKMRGYTGTAKKAAPSSKRAGLGAAPAYSGNELPFSRVFGFKPPSGIEHAVPVFDEKDWHEDVRYFIPDIDPLYIYPEAETEAAVVAVLRKRPLLVIGPKGSGKTTLEQQIAARMRLPWFRVNCRDDMDSSTLLGTPNLSGGSLDWTDGPLPLLGMHGGLLTVDEQSAAPAGVALVLQAPLEPNGPIYIPDKPKGQRYIKPHPWFRIAATDNTQLQGDTTGRYAGTKVQNEALIDRFLTTVKLDYLSETHERAIVTSRVPSLPSDWLDKMMEVVRLIRRAADTDALNFSISPRGIITWAEDAVYWGDIAVSFRLAFLNKLIDEDRKTVIELFLKATSLDLNRV